LKLLTLPWQVRVKVRVQVRVRVRALSDEILDSHKFEIINVISAGWGLFLLFLHAF
jgi:hypothetical protein